MSATSTPHALLAEARTNIHAAVAERGDRRRMFAHHAATLSADAALHPDAEPSQRATARCYLEETAGLMERAAEESAIDEEAVGVADRLPT